MNIAEGRPLHHWAFMRLKNFSRGVEDYRCGRKFDTAPNLDDDYYAYERGRQWAASAPSDMPHKFGRKPNPDAVRIFRDLDIL